MALGVFPISRVKSLNGQYLETSFFLLFVPLFPVWSRFVTKNSIKGRNYLMAKIQRSGVIKGYLTLWSALIAFLGFTLSNVQGWSYLLAVGGIFTVVFLISLQLFKATKEEIKKRKIFEEYTGVNALPEWLTEESQRAIFKGIQGALPADMRTSWKERVVTEEDPKTLEILYVVSAYYKELKPSADSEAIFELCKEKAGV